MTTRYTWIAVGLGSAAAMGLVISAHSQSAPATRAVTLKSVNEFAAIGDEKERSIALFQEAGKVITHPRCANCHPADEHPRQGLMRTVHKPSVVRGADDLGAVGMRCTTCHGPANYDPAGIPGNPQWRLAPLSMAWDGKSLGSICEQIKDPARNGGKTLDQIVEHMAHDDLVGWGWAPGKSREAVPGTQEQFGQLIATWKATGAHCPQG